MDPVSGPLAGVRVLDLADYRGALCARLLGELGASVVKVEPRSGDPARALPPFADVTPLAGPSLFFTHRNAGKASVALDPDDDRAQVAALVDAAHVLVVTALPESLVATALDCASLAQRCPGLVYVSITPFGATGPWRTRPGTDLTIQAAGGMVGLNGNADEPPLQGVGLPAYHLASVAAAVGTLLAILAQRRTGRGQHVDVSMHACVAAAVLHATTLYQDTGRVLTRQGPRHWSGDFHVGSCTDGDVLHSVLGDWTTLREWVHDGRAEGPLEDPALSSVAGRRAHADRVFAALDAWAGGWAAEDLAAAAQLRRLAYAAVRSPASLRTDRQLRERAAFVPTTHPGAPDSLVQQAAPYRFSLTPCPPPARPPTFQPGTHLGPTVRGPWSALAAGTGPVAGPRLPHRAATPRVTAPLEGIRVLDLTWLVAGPLTTRVLADHGADVIRVDRPGTARGEPPNGGLDGRLNRGKRSIAIDLQHAAGRTTFERLIAAADVLVENFSPRVLLNWGWDDARLLQLNPRLVTLHLSAFGRTGPDRDTVAFGPTLQARSGHTWLMRHRAGQRAGWGFAFSDIVAGWRGALAVLAALWHRSASGRGQAIDLSQYESLVSALGPLALDGLNSTRLPLPIDNASQEVPSAPHGVFRCADDFRDGHPYPRWCAIAVLDDSQWQALAAAMGTPPWSRDARLRTATGRLALAAQVDARIAVWTRRRRASAVVARLAARGVPAAVVADAADLCDDDPQLAARGYWQRVALPRGHSAVVDGIPFTLAATPAQSARPAPRPGEHTAAVLSGLAGLSAAELAALRAAGTIE